MLVPAFARPSNILSFDNKAAFISCLRHYGIAFEMWPESETKVTELWDEICDRDVVYITGDLFGEPNILVRFLITVAVRVVMRHPEYGIIVLIELVRKGGHYHPRKHGSSSLSEKSVLRADGTPLEKGVDTIKRCLFEEPGIDVTTNEILEGLHFVPWLTKERVIGEAEHVEQHFHEKTFEMPGLRHFNQIAHYISYLPTHAHFLGWRQDKGTRYLSRWISTHEGSAQLDPIPVELILKKPSRSA